VALCAGLLSQLPGEHHIASQLKDTVSECSEYRWSDTLMQEWFSSTLHLSRELRQATSHIIKSIDIEELTLKYITSELNDATSHTFTIIGTGMVGSKLLTLVLDTFKNSRVNFVYHNSIPEIPDQYSHRVNVVQLGDMYSSISTSDIIISAINADTPVIRADHAQILKANSILIDLSVPRTIDPALASSLTSQKLIDMDNLKIWYRLEQVDRNQLLTICKEIVVENREMYDKFITSITGQQPSQ
jgi:glutamyl-tRNA reductase